MSEQRCTKEEGHFDLGSAVLPALLMAVLVSIPWGCYSDSIARDLCREMLAVAPTAADSLVIALDDSNCRSVLRADE